MTATPEALDRHFAAASHEYPSRGRLQRYLDRLFDGCPLAGRSVLDIAGGNVAFASALSGVGSVTPDARTSQAFDPGDERYDAVLMHNSVNQPAVVKERSA